MSEINYEKETNTYYFNCPHDDCRLLIGVRKDMINCKIFRHGVHKKNLKQMDPHTKKEICDKLKEKDLIFGCGKPFFFDGNKLEICGYI